MFIDSSTTLTSIGFWLPIGRANFFDNQRDQQLVENYNGQNARRTDPLKGYRLIDDIDVPHPRLQASVYHRLCSVLPSYIRWTHNLTPLPVGVTMPEGACYDTIIPLYPRARIGYHNDADPIGVLSCCNIFKASEWHHVRTAMHGLILIVSADGFYLWIALHDQTVDHDHIEKALTDHVKSLVGNDFYSHFVGDKNNLDVSVQREQSTTLRHYQDYNLGILNFFQINTIFEGMNNYNFDPRIFFDNSSGAGVSDTQPATVIDYIKQTYAIGPFIEELLTMPRFVRADHPYDKEISLQDTPTIQRVTNVTSTVSATSDTQMEHALIDHLKPICDLAHAPLGINWLFALSDIGRLSLSPLVRRDLVGQFLRKTSTITMQMTKWRIESCRRALLVTMVQLPSRRQPLVQAEIPSFDPSNIRTNDPAADQHKYVVTNVNETQLRDYITLLSAKLPLLLNVNEYLDIALNTIGKAATDDTAPSSTVPQEETLRESLYTAEHSWRAQLQGIEFNIRALENAIEQVYMAKMLTETEKLRAEEETLAEIERIRDRTGSGLSSFDNNTVDIISNIIAIVTSIVAVLLVLPNYGPLLSYIELVILYDWTSVILAIVCTILGVVALGLAYFSLHFIVESITRFVQHHLNIRRRSRDEQYYYEMDVRLDADISEIKALQLINGNFEVETIQQQIEQHYPQHPRIHMGKRYQPQRSSYRVDRSNADESMHKVYIDALIYWPRSFARRSLLLAQKRMRLFLVYEIYYHRPSGKPAYMLRDLRLVSTSANMLDEETIGQIKYLTATQFINNWIDPQREEQQIRLLHQTTSDAEQRLDALFALSEAKYLHPHKLPTHKTR